MSEGMYGSAEASDAAKAFFLVLTVYSGLVLLRLSLFLASHLEHAQFLCSILASSRLPPFSWVS